MDEDMDENETIYHLLKQGVEVAEIVDAIESNRVRIDDEFGRVNKKLSDRDKESLLKHLAIHYEMICEKKWMEPHDRVAYYWSCFYDESLHYQEGSILIRTWLVDDLKRNTPKKSQFNSETGTVNANKRHAPANVEKERVRQLAIPFIERGSLKHRQIVAEIESNHSPTISHQLTLKVVKEQCKSMGKGHLVSNSKENLDLT